MNLEGIAQKAGVSTATVSLALNNRQGVSRRTRDRILGIAKEVGYKKRPSRAMVRGTVQLLKLIRHGHTLNQDHNVFIADYIDGITHKAKDVHLRVEFASTPATTDISELTLQMDQQDVAGFLILGTELSARGHHGHCRGPPARGVPRHLPRLSPVRLRGHEQPRLRLPRRVPAGEGGSSGPSGW